MRSPSSRLAILCWAHPQSKPKSGLGFLKRNKVLNEIAPVIVSPKLQAVLSAALAMATAVVVLRPVEQAEHDMVEEFLLTIDRKNLVNTHYVIVISAMGKRFKSGVQSHSVINSLDEAAVTRAVFQALMACAPDEGVLLTSDKEIPSDEMEPLPKTSLAEYFKLPEFRKATVLSALSSDEREQLMVALVELQREETGVAPDFDILERAVTWIRKSRGAEIAILSATEILRLAPVQAQSWDGLAMVPASGNGSLASDSQLYRALAIEPSKVINFWWVAELSCCLLAWSGRTADNLFAQALIYSLLRIRQSANFRHGRAA